MKAVVIGNTGPEQVQIEAFLQRLGFVVEQFADVGSATDVTASSGGIDLAVLPVADGSQQAQTLDRLQAVRGMEVFAAVRLLMVGASGSYDDIAAALAAGADEYLMPPLEMESLQTKLQLLGFDVSDAVRH